MNIFFSDTNETYDQMDIEYVDNSTLRMLSVKDGMALDFYLDLHEIRTKPNSKRGQALLLSYNNILIPLQNGRWNNLSSWPHDISYSAPVRIFLPSDLSTIDDSIIEVYGDNDTVVNLINFPDKQTKIPIFTEDQGLDLRYKVMVHYEIIGPKTIKPNDIANYTLELKNSFGPVPATNRLYLNNTAGYISHNEFMMNGRSKVDFSLRALDLLPGDNVEFECRIRNRYIQQANKLRFNVNVVE